MCASMRWPRTSRLVDRLCTADSIPIWSTTGAIGSASLKPNSIEEQYLSQSRRLFFRRFESLSDRPCARPLVNSLLVVVHGASRGEMVVLQPRIQLRAEVVDGILHTRTSSLASKCFARPPEELFLAPLHPLGCRDADSSLQHICCTS